MSRIYEALKGAQESVRRNHDAINLVRLEPKQGFVECRSDREHITVRLLDNELALAKQSSAAGILLGINNQGPESTLAVECHARIPGAQRRTPFDDLYHLNTFVDRWNLNPGRSLEIVGLYRFTDQDQADLTHQDLTALKAIEREAPLIFLLVEPCLSGFTFHLFVMRRGSIVANWILPATTEQSVVEGNQKTLPEFAGARRIYLPPAPSELGSQATPPLRRAWLRPVGLAVIVALVLILISAVRASRPVNNASLDLRLAREGSEWRLTWDPNSRILRHATGGRLVIVDGNLEKTLELDTVDLSSGAILYSGATNDLVFRLQIQTSDLRKPIIQSVRAVDRPSSVTLFTAEPEVIVRPRISSTTAVNPLVPQTIPKTFASNMSRPNMSKMPSSFLSKLPVIPPELPPSMLQDSRLDPLGLVLPGASPVAPPSSPNLRENAFEPAQLMVRREPIYPERVDDLDGVVKMQFLITDTGMVRDVKITNGNPVLGAAAKAAVEKWRYRPARQNGHPIQTEGMAVITFNHH